MYIIYVTKGYRLKLTTKNINYLVKAVFCPWVNIISFCADIAGTPRNTLAILASTEYFFVLNTIVITSS